LTATKATAKVTSKAQGPFEVEAAEVEKGLRLVKPVTVILEVLSFEYAAGDTKLARVKDWRAVLQMPTGPVGTNGTGALVLEKAFRIAFNTETDDFAAFEHWSSTPFQKKLEANGPAIPQYEHTPPEQSLACLQMLDMYGS